ncbi:polyprenyl synthetase family protein [Hazenella sp. IB182357]|uniref:Farnesyl diphosphate synthase n=1 Tax=Polycladospora coralii TaxID=2771432 RepID=A0A926NB36_9BACL|nr:farnesyl diphosphate synthase [Polycladospora coralii]MBD1373253.1 polyprenyl synthetase family protein [Polycladospora coralii]
MEKRTISVRGGRRVVLTVKDYMKDKAVLIDSEMERYLKQKEHVPEILIESMQYSLIAGGKRLRPILVLATVHALGGEEEKALPFACAIEMIHTYSLIHDDLPAMDNDDYRRGKKTNHKVFGEAQAILAGDALLTEAFGLLVAGIRSAGLELNTALSVIEEASRFAGMHGMIAGQVSDLLSENKKISLEELAHIHKRKTGDLIAFAVRTGARIAGADEKTLEGLTRYAYGLGLAFQIQDDILDVIGDQAVLGKPVGSDIEQNKSTYPALIGLEESKQKLAVVTQTAKEELEKLPIDATQLLALADYLLVRKK